MDSARLDHQGTGLARSWPSSLAGELERLRLELFETSGYCVVRAFCSVQESREIRRFWHRHPMPYGEKGYWRARANYAMTRGGVVQRYECFFWNPPEHPLTYELAWSAHALRNVLTGSPLAASVLPFGGLATTYRPTRTDAGDAGIRLHLDRLQPGQTHLIQVSLALSTQGTDYDGGGTRLRRDDGRLINVHDAERLAAGDLLLFNQALEHSVDPVLRSDPDDPLSGHWRMLMPDHPIGRDKRDAARLLETLRAVEYETAGRPPAPDGRRAWLRSLVPTDWLARLGQLRSRPR